MGFRYCVLGEPLFNERGKIRESVGYDDLASFVWLTLTGEPLPDNQAINAPFLGEIRGVGIYLIYNGNIQDRIGNRLTLNVLTKLPAFDGQKLIYCAGCRVNRDRLNRVERVSVRQIPYQIEVL